MLRDPAPKYLFLQPRDIIKAYNGMSRLNIRESVLIQLLVNCDT